MHSLYGAEAGPVRQMDEPQLLLRGDDLLEDRALSHRRVQDAQLVIEVVQEVVHFLLRRVVVCAAHAHNNDGFRSTQRMTANINSRGST